MMVDLNDVSMISLPVNKVKAIIGMTQKHFGGRLYRQFLVNMAFMLRKSTSVFLNFVDDITQQKISAHNDKTYKAELLKLISPDNLEVKYGGQKPDITSNFFPPEINQPGKQMMTLEQLKAQCPAAVKYIAPWGQKRAQEEEQKAQQAAREQDIKQREELLTPTRRISSSGIS